MDFYTSAIGTTISPHRPTSQLKMMFARKRNQEGDCSRPSQRKNCRAFRTSFLPKSLVGKAEGNYFVNYVFYAGPQSLLYNSGPIVDLYYYVAYDPPYNFLDSTSAMWGKKGKGFKQSQPDNAAGCITNKTACEPVIMAEQGSGRSRGLADVPINKELKSIICEFPSEK